MPSTAMVMHKSQYSQCKSLQNKGHSVRLSSEVRSGHCKTVYGQTVDLQERQAMLNRVPASSIVHQCLEKHTYAHTHKGQDDENKKRQGQQELNLR